MPRRHQAPPGRQRHGRAHHDQRAQRRHRESGERGVTGRPTQREHAPDGPGRAAQAAEQRGVPECTAGEQQHAGDEPDMQPGDGHQVHRPGAAQERPIVLGQPMSRADRQREHESYRPVRVGGALDRGRQRLPRVHRRARADPERNHTINRRYANVPGRADPALEGPALEIEGARVAESAWPLQAHLELPLLTADQVTPDGTV